MSQASMQKSSEKLAKKMLRKYGGSCIYTVVVPESTDQTDGSTIPASATPYTISTYQRSGTLKELESNQVTSTQRVFLVEAKALPVPPSADDEILMNGETLKYSATLKSISAGQTDVLYYCIFGI